MSAAGLRARSARLELEPPLEARGQLGARTKHTAGRARERQLELSGEEHQAACVARGRALELPLEGVERNPPARERFCTVRAVTQDGVAQEGEVASQLVVVACARAQAHERYRAMARARVRAKRLELPSPTPKRAQCAKEREGCGYTRAIFVSAPRKVGVPVAGARRSARELAAHLCDSREVASGALVGERRVDHARRAA